MCHDKLCCKHEEQMVLTLNVTLREKLLIFMWIVAYNTLH